MVSHAPGAVPFEQLVAAYRGALERRARQLCRKHFDPDDLVQEVLVRALRHYGTLRNPENPLPWLLQILNRTFVDLLRQRGSGRQSESLDELEVPQPPQEPAPAWSTITEDQLRAAVERLPDDVRECYRLHALEGRDYALIAKTLKIPGGTVGSRLTRARRMLREMLLPQGGENES